MTQVLTRVAYDGKRRVEFRGAVLAAATTQQPGSTRWTEITVYRTQRVDEDGATGLYVVAKVGRSILAHRRTCLTTNTRGMDAWRATPEQGVRIACLECRPSLDPGLPPGDVVVERDRCRLFQANGQLQLERIIFPHRASCYLIGMTGRLVTQLRERDPDFAAYWSARVEPQLIRE